MFFHGDDSNDDFKLFAAVVIKEKQQASAGWSSCWHGPSIPCRMWTSKRNKCETGKNMKKKSPLGFMVIKKPN
jgi:hypothetical protein